MIQDREFDETYVHSAIDQLDTWGGHPATVVDHLQTIEEAQI
jgi:hypothetical protein